MPFLIVLILAAIVVLAILTLAVHFLFSPWLLLAAMVVLAWVRFRPGRSRNRGE